MGVIRYGLSMEREGKLIVMVVCMRVIGMKGKCKVRGKSFTLTVTFIGANLKTINVMVLVCLFRLMAKYTKGIGFKIDRMERESRNLKMGLFTRVSSRMVPKMDLAVFHSVGRKFMKVNGLKISLMAKANKRLKMGPFI